MSSKMIAASLETLERRYNVLGVSVTNWIRTTDHLYLATGFRCEECGTPFLPDGQRVRNRHRCPNGCNAGKTL